MNTPQTIVVVEDDEDDFFFTERTLRRHTTAAIIHVQSGNAAIAYLAGGADFSDRSKFPLPDIMLVDLKMEQGTGLDVLAAVRRNPPNPLPRIYVLTGSNEPKDRELVLKSGVAEGYIVKPLSNEHVARILRGEVA